ncbi:MAG: pyrroline-5-carboxylate reductase [Candidatus Acetothermia bacterium]|jgi:pyrroline-5-carboxylate reductase|nr:pyrroline-5-carboxylate reductase [Candidatus Acetothermia bacterium]
MRIGVIGVGTIGAALVEGLLRAGAAEPQDIAGTTGHPESAMEAKRRLGIDVHTDNRALARDRDVVILAVKPATMPKVLAEVKDLLSPSQVVITLAAATPIRSVEEALGRPIPVIRAMPNTPCQIGQGMTALCPGRHAGPHHLALARAVFSPLGRVATVDDEGLMDAVTALSGSGPAYAYIIIEALAEGGVKMGLPRKLATELAAQALLGGAALVLQSGQHPAVPKADVTTPAGVTIDGLMALEEGGLRVALIKAVVAATERAKTLAR